MKIEAPLLFCMLAVAACTVTTEKKSEPVERRVVINDTIPRERAQVNPKPVAAYKISVPDPLNPSEFSVKLLETPLRFRYHALISYKGLKVKDSVDIPNFGLQPKVDVKKYKGNLSCMIGFYDAQGNFKDLKKVEVVGKQLKILQVQRYGVGTVKVKQ